MRQNSQKHKKTPKNAVKRGGSSGKTKKQKIVFFFI